MGHKIPQYLRFISFVFTTEFRIHYGHAIGEIYSKNFPNAQWKSERATCEPVWFSCASQDENYGSHGTIFQLNCPLWVLYSGILKKLLTLYGTLDFCNVVKIKILFSISTLINCFSSSWKLKLSFRAEIRKSTILCNFSNWECYYTAHFRKYVTKFDSMSRYISCYKPIFLWRGPLILQCWPQLPLFSGFSLSSP
jgi:hypothetical protein